MSLLEGRLSRRKFLGLGAALVGVETVAALLPQGASAKEILPTLEGLHRIIPNVNLHNFEGFNGAEKAVWSNGSQWWVRKGATVLGGGERWTSSDGRNWSFQGEVAYAIPGGCSATNTDLQRSKGHGADHYNDVTKWAFIVNPGDVADNSRETVAVLFQHDGTDRERGWAEVFYANGQREFVPQAGDRFESLVAQSQSNVLQ